MLHGWLQSVQGFMGENQDTGKFLPSPWHLQVTGISTYMTEVFCFETVSWYVALADLEVVT